MNRDEFIDFEPQKKGRVTRILFYVFSTIIIAMLVILLCTVVLVKSEGEPPAIFGHRLFIVTSESMQPAIKAGSVIAVKIVPPDSLKVNDIITFKDGYDQNSKRIINTHRIIRSEPTNSGLSFSTRGDNNQIDDKDLRKPEDIYGKVVWISAGFGAFITFLKSPMGLILCIAFPLLLILGIEIFNLIKVNRRGIYDDDEEQEEAVDPATLFGTHTDNPSPPQVRSIGVTDEAVEDEEEIPMEIPPPRIDSTLYGRLNMKNSKMIFTPKELDHKITTSTDDEQANPSEPISTIADEQGVLNDMNGFAFLRTKKIITKGEEEAAQVRVLNQYASGNKNIALMTNEDAATFDATVQSKGRDRFIVDGIDCVVQPTSIHLGFDEEGKGREVSITVTKEYTNVVIECKDYEVNFALFKDEETDDDKVIIQRKPKQ